MDMNDVEHRQTDVPCFTALTSCVPDAAFPSISKEDPPPAKTGLTKGALFSDIFRIKVYLTLCLKHKAPLFYNGSIYAS